jgi:hypothetical protein
VPLRARRNERGLLHAHDPRAAHGLHTACRTAPRLAPHGRGGRAGDLPSRPRQLFSPYLSRGGGGQSRASSLAPTRPPCLRLQAHWPGRVAELVRAVQGLEAALAVAEEAAAAARAAADDEAGRAAGLAALVGELSARLEAAGAGLGAESGGAWGRGEESARAGGWVGAAEGCGGAGEAELTPGRAAAARSLAHALFSEEEEEDEDEAAAAEEAEGRAGLGLAAGEAGFTAPAAVGSSWAGAGPPPERHHSGLAARWPATPPCAEAAVQTEPEPPPPPPPPASASAAGALLAAARDEVVRLTELNEKLLAARGGPGGSTGAGTLEWARMLWPKACGATAPESGERPTAATHPPPTPHTPAQLPYPYAHRPTAPCRPVSLGGAGGREGRAGGGARGGGAAGRRRGGR